MRLIRYPIPAGGPRSALTRATLAAILLIGCSCKSKDDAPLDVAPGVTQPSVERPELQTSEVDAEQGSSQPMADVSSSEGSKANDAYQSLLASYKVMKPNQREAAVREHRASCMFGNETTMDAIRGAAADDKESQKLRVLGLRGLRACWAKMLASSATKGSDGTELAVGAVREVVTQLGMIGIPDLETLPKTSRAEAIKDPEGARGKFLRVSGRILQIRKEGDYFAGTLSVDGGVVYFITVGETTGLVDGSSATIAGLFIQRYSYPNMMGGMTESTVVAGRFTGQSDSDPPIPARRFEHEAECCGGHRGACMCLPAGVIQCCDGFQNRTCQCDGSSPR